MLDYLRNKDIQIQIYGLGYVGLPLASKLSSSGFKVIGIDKDTSKIQRLLAGKLFDSEQYLKKDFETGIDSENLKIVTNTTPSDKPTIAIICVPTPIPSDSISSDVYVKDAAGSFLKTAKKGDMIILESSIEVGTTDRIQEMIEKAGFTVGEDFGLAFCPERIDPKNTKWKLENIPRVIYCSDDTTFEICQEIYRFINNANLHRVGSAKVAEVVKSFENTFRLVNISLVNELAMLCDQLKINVKDVLDAAATKPFGFMPFYPSAGAGGHCIPKDPRFLLESAKHLGIDFKTLQNSLFVNAYIPKYIANSIKHTIQDNHMQPSVIVCGLSYKPDIEDMRDSPGFKVMSELTKIGLSAKGYDPFFKEELRPIYAKENNLTKDFEVIKSLDEAKGHGCLCIVQHHTKDAFYIGNIYKNSLVPLIYDCQNKIEYDPSSKTLLRRLGGNI